jgi:hypothetical protein
MSAVGRTAYEVDADIVELITPTGTNSGSGAARNCPSGSNPA